jgi:RNA polymerase sigma factor (sigma-70 family)
MSVHASPASVTDVGELYRALSTRLEQIVRLGVGASEADVEDACQFAWDRLLEHRARVRRDTAFAWLAQIAVREARRLLGREARYLSLDATAAVAGDSGLRGDLSSIPEELILNRERLWSIGRLPERQQRMIWLHALGLSYAEIAVYTGCTARTVERQLLRAKRSLRQTGRAIGRQAPSSVRAARQPADHRPQPVRAA